jgi:hypothetical protein
MNFHEHRQDFDDSFYENKRRNNQKENQPEERNFLVSSMRKSGSNSSRKVSFERHRNISPKNIELSELNKKLNQCQTSMKKKEFSKNLKEGKYQIRSDNPSLRNDENKKQNRKSNFPFESPQIRAQDKINTTVSYHERENPIPIISILKRKTEDDLKDNIPQSKRVHFRFENGSSTPNPDNHHRLVTVSNKDILKKQRDELLAQQKSFLENIENFQREKSTKDLRKPVPFIESKKNQSIPKNSSDLIKKTNEKKHFSISKVFFLCLFLF